MRLWYIHEQCRRPWGGPLRGRRISTGNALRSHSGPPAQEKILSDLNLALHQQIKELTEQLAQAQTEFKKTQEESQALAVAISTHKAALSLDKITLEQAKELQQYYARLAEQKAKAAATLTPDLEKFTKIQGELTEATRKSQGELDHPAKTPAKTAPQRALEQQNQQYLKLAAATINKLEELQKVTLARLEVLKQEQVSLEEFSLTLQKFAEEKFKTQLLERQKPTDIFTLTRELLAESLSLPQRFYDWAVEKIQSGTAARLVKTHRSKLHRLAVLPGHFALCHDAAAASHPGLPTEACGRGRYLQSEIDHGPGQRPGTAIIICWPSISGWHYPCRS